MYNVLFQAVRTFIVYFLVYIDPQVSLLIISGTNILC